MKDEKQMNPVQQYMWDEIVTKSRADFEELERIVKQQRDANRLPYFDAPEMATLAHRLAENALAMRNLPFTEMAKIDESKA